MIPGRAARRSALRAVLGMHAFFDDSGDFTSSGYSYLVGWISNMDGWNAFSPEWLRLCQSKQLPWLHTSDFLTGNGDYRKVTMTYEERQESIKQFIGVIRKHVFGGYAIGIDPAAYRRVFQDFPKRVGPDVFCMLRLMRYVSDHTSEWDQSDFLECAFDESDKNAHRFLSAWQKLKRRDDVSRRLLSSILFGDDKSIQPLQAADLLGVAVQKKLANTLRDDDPLNLLFSTPDDPTFGPFLGFEVWDEEALRAEPSLANLIASASRPS